MSTLRPDSAGYNQRVPGSVSTHLWCSNIWVTILHLYYRTLYTRMAVTERELLTVVSSPRQVLQRPVRIPPTMVFLALFVIPNIRNRERERVRELISQEESTVRPVSSDIELNLAPNLRDLSELSRWLRVWERTSRQGRRRHRPR